MLMGEKTYPEIGSEAGIGQSSLSDWVKNRKKDGYKTLTEKRKTPIGLDCGRTTECFDGNRCHARRGACFLVP